MAAELAKGDLALKYHLLEAMIGTEVEPPIERFRVGEALDALKRQLRVSPFGRARTRQALREMARDGLVAAKKERGRLYYEVTRPGRQAYRAYKEVMILWRMEKRFGEKLELKTITKISPRRSRQDKFHMPMICDVKMPLSFRPVRHRFEEDREIRVCEVGIIRPGRP